MRFLIFLLTFVFSCFSFAQNGIRQFVYSVKNDFQQITFQNIDLQELKSIYFDYEPDVYLMYSTSSFVDGKKTYTQRLTLGTYQGVSLNNYLSVGLNLDINFFTHYFRNEGMRCAMNPYFTFRAKYPLLYDKISLFLDFGLGANCMLTSKNAGFFCILGPGLNYNNYKFMLGLECLGVYKCASHFFMKLSYQF